MNFRIIMLVNLAYFIEFRFVFVGFKIWFYFNLIIREFIAIFRLIVAYFLFADFALLSFLVILFRILIMFRLFLGL
jgi:hypothetical protein